MEDQLQLLGGPAPAAKKTKKTKKGQATTTTRRRAVAPPVPPLVPTLAPYIGALTDRRYDPTAWKPGLNDGPDVADDEILRYGARPSSSGFGRVVYWFVTAYGARQLPGEPFKLSPGQTVTNPGRFYRRLRRVLSTGPKGITPPTVETLQTLHYLYRTDAPDVKQSLQVTHRGTPKMVCIVFRHNGRLMALHEATATQNHSGTASPGGVDYATLVYLQKLGVVEWHHYTKPDGPLWVTSVPTLFNQGIYQEVDDRARYFLPVTMFAQLPGRDYKPPWVEPGSAVVLDWKTGEPTDIEPAKGKTPRRRAQTA